MEQSGFSGGLSEALKTLKMELMEIREQDVDLMKQLLTMENSINTLKPKTTNSVKKRQEQKWRRTGTVTLLPEVKEEDINCFCNRRGSCCSSDGSISSTDESSLSSSDDSDSEDRPEIVAYQSSSLSQTSLYYYKNKSKESRYTRETNDEHVLISNIKVWKYRQSQLNHSVL